MRYSLVVGKFSTQQIFTLKYAKQVNGNFESQFSSKNIITFQNALNAQSK